MADLLYEALDDLKRNALPEHFEIVKRLCNAIDRERSIATLAEHTLRMNEHFRAENTELRRLLALKEAQLISMTAQYEAAMRDLFQCDQDAKHYKRAVCYASLWRRVRYAFTGVFR